LFKIIILSSLLKAQDVGLEKCFNQNMEFYQ